MQLTPADGRRVPMPITRYRRVTLYPPGGQPIEIDGQSMLGIGPDPQSGAIVVVARGDGGGIRKYLGFAVLVEEEPPSGLVG